MMNIPMRRVGLAFMLAVGAVLVLASVPAFGRRAQVARAAAVRARCVAALGAKRSWRADIVQTEIGSDGSRAVLREQLLVRRTGESRLTLTETDTEGRRVVSTTIRSGDRMTTRRVDADGSTVLHVIKGVRPTLGTELDNALGQTVQAIADASPLRVVGRATRAGEDTDKLQLGPGLYAWVSARTGLPVEEQIVSDGAVAHDMTFSNVEADVAVNDSDFDAASLGHADRTVTEDLGFREVTSPGAAAAKIGFMPLCVAHPQGFSLDEQGFVDPGIPGGDAGSEAAFVQAFSNGVDRVLITQVHRAGLGDSVPAAASEGPDPATATSVAGHPAVAYDDGSRCQLVLARRDILVTIEGQMSESNMKAFAEQIR